MPFPRPNPGQVITNSRITNSSFQGQSILSSLSVTGDLVIAGDIGFFGETPVSQQTALTAQHATLTQAGTDSGDVAIQALVNVGPFGFVNAAEGEAVVACVLNLMVRVQELEDKLQAYGLLA